MDEPDLRVEDLRVAINRLLDAVEDQHGPALRFDVDYYWNVPFSTAFDPYTQPRLDMGQVSDDVESVHHFIASSDDEMVSIWHEADHLAGVLRAISKTDISPR